MVRPVLQVLRTNRKILQETMRTGVVVSKQDLLERGFHPGFCTEHIHLNGQDYYFCFDIGFKEEYGRLILLYRKGLEQTVRPLPEITRQLINQKTLEPGEQVKNKL
jgi:hypothetical protein